MNPSQEKFSEETYRLITENINDILGIVNEQLTLELVNAPTCLKILGYESDEILGKNPLEFIHPDDYKKSIRAFNKGLIEGRGELEVRIRHKDGNYLWFELKGSAFFDTSNVKKSIISGREITKRKEVEKKLLESEEKYRLLSENANDIVGILNEKYEIEYVNELTFKKISGYELEDVLGKNCLEFIHPDDIKNAIKSLQKGTKKGEGNIELRFRLKDGSYKWFEGSGRVFNDSQGKIKGSIVLRDITKSREIEQSLRDSEEKYRSLFEFSPYMVILIDYNGKIIDFNSNTLTHLNYTRSELIGKDFRDLDFLILEHLDQLKNLFRELLTKGNISPIELKIPNEDINIDWVSLQASMVEIENKKLIQVILQDISKRKDAEQKLKTSERNYRHLFERSPNLIVLLNNRGDIVDVNSTIKNYMNSPTKDLIGSNFRELPFISNEALELLKKGFIEMFSKGSSEPIEIYIDHEEVNLNWINLQASMVEIENKKLIQVILQDITDKKVAELKLKESEEKYHEAFNQADFYKNLFAHDISNIINVIGLNLELGPVNLNDPEKIKDLESIIKRIKGQVNRAKNLITNIRKLSEIEETKPLLYTIDLCKFLKKSIFYVSSSFQERKIEIKVDSFEQRIIVQANDLISEVFENLFINALKYNDNPVVKINVKISKEKKEGLSYLKLEFFDNGIGISDDRKKVIFQKNVKKDELSKGMGIGLTLVKKIVESYNWKIWVEDRVKGDYSSGSNFIILLPKEI